MMHKNRCLHPRQPAGKRFFNTILLCGADKKEQNIYIKGNIANTHKKNKPKKTKAKQPVKVSEKWLLIQGQSIKRGLYIIPTGPVKHPGQSEVWALINFRGNSICYWKLSLSGAIQHPGFLDIKTQLHSNFWPFPKKYNVFLLFL